MSGRQHSITAPYTFVEFTVAGNPRPKGRPRVVRGHTYSPPETAAAESLVAWEARAAMGSTEPVRSELTVEAWFYMQTARRVDCDNLGKLLLDSLIGVVFVDDSQIIDLHLHRRIDRARPRTDVRVWLTADVPLASSARSEGVRSQAGSGDAWGVRSKAKT